MRRKDREMDRDFVVYVMNKCEYAVISMVDVNGMPYCIPITIACGENCIYFHSAKEGFKTECFENNNNVCISCVGDTRRSESEFTTEYESAVIRGKVCEVTDDSEKINALRLLCERHTPLNMNNFENAIVRSLSRTAVWKVEISEITGKRKKYDSDGKEMKFMRMK